MIEYFLVRAQGENRVSELDRMVNQLLKVGWELYGSPFSGAHFEEHILYQAVIKREERESSR